MSETTITIQRQKVIDKLQQESDPSKIQCVKRCLALDPKKERRRITRRQNREVINRQNRESRVRREGRAVIAKKIVRTMTALEESGAPCDDQLGRLRGMLRQLYPSAKELISEIGEPETGSMEAEAPKRETGRMAPRETSRVSVRAYSPVVELSEALADLGLPSPGEQRRMESAAPKRETGRMQPRASARVSFSSEANQPPLLTKRKTAAKPAPRIAKVSPTAEEIAERRAERTQRGAPAGAEATPQSEEEILNILQDPSENKIIREKNIKILIEYHKRGLKSKDKPTAFGWSEPSKRKQDASAYFRKLEEFRELENPEKYKEIVKNDIERKLRYEEEEYPKRLSLIENMKFKAPSRRLKPGELTQLENKFNADKDKQIRKLKAIHEYRKKNIAPDTKKEWKSYFHTLSLAIQMPGTYSHNAMVADWYRRCKFILANGTRCRNSVQELELYNWRKPCRERGEYCTLHGKQYGQLEQLRVPFQECLQENQRIDDLVYGKLESQTIEQQRESIPYIKSRVYQLDKSIRKTYRPSNKEIREIRELLFKLKTLDPSFTLKEE